MYIPLRSIFKGNENPEAYVLYTEFARTVTWKGIFELFQRENGESPRQTPGFSFEDMFNMESTSKQPPPKDPRILTRDETIQKAKEAGARVLVLKYFKILCVLYMYENKKLH
jgi:hypothetical protein